MLRKPLLWLIRKKANRIVRHRRRYARIWRRFGLLLEHLYWSYKWYISFSICGLFRTFCAYMILSLNVGKHLHLVSPNFEHYFVFLALFKDCSSSTKDNTIAVRPLQIVMWHCDVRSDAIKIRCTSNPNFPTYQTKIVS